MEENWQDYPGRYPAQSEEPWEKIRSRVQGNQEVGQVCDKSGQVLCEEEVSRWKEYFASLLQGEGAHKSKPNAGMGMEKGYKQGKRAREHVCGRYALVYGD